MRLFVMASALIIASTPALADDFGSRFGNSSPYALQNGFDKAQADNMGIGLDDLNDIINIEPAGGDEVEEVPAVDPNAVQTEGDQNIPFDAAPAETPEGSKEKEAENL